MTEPDDVGLPPTEGERAERDRKAVAAFRRWQEEDPQRWNDIVDEAERVFNYAVNVTRGAQYWVVDVPGIQRVTQARHLREVETMARDLISIMTDADPDSFDIDVHIEASPEEMAEDIADFDAAMAEGGPAIPWDQVKADLGWGEDD